MIKKNSLIIILLLLQLVGECALAQDFKSCQVLFEKVLSQFNQSFEENNSLIISSVEYRRDLIELQKSHQIYHKENYNPSDSIQKLNNEAVLNILSGNYSKGLRLLRSIDSLDSQSTYYLGLVYLLNEKYDDAISILANSAVSKSSNMNALVAYGKSGKVHQALELSQTLTHGSLKGKWNYNVGLLYKLNQQYEESVTELNTAIRQDDNGIAYRLLRGDVLMKIKESKRAVSDFGKVAKRHPKAQIRYANALVDLKRFQEAQVVFEEYLEEGDRTFRKDAFLGLGHTYYGLSQFTEALRYYQLASSMIKDSPVAICGQANVLVTQHQYQKAKVLYNRILNADSTYQSAWLGRGITQYGDGKYQQALKDFSKSASLFNNEDKTLADIFVCRAFSKYYTKQAAAALPDFETAIQLDGTRYEALAGLSSIMIDIKSFPQAGQYLSRALNYEKTNDKMWSNYGNLLLHFGMYTKSYEVFRKAIGVNPENIKAQNGWGVVMVENDQLNQAKVLFDSLVTANPTIPYLRNNLGIVNAYHGNRLQQRNQKLEADAFFQTAFDDFNEALELDPSKKFYNVNVGNIYKSWEKYDKAKLSYQIYQDKSAINNLGVLSAGQGNTDNAKYYLGVAMELDSNHRVFQFNMSLLVKDNHKELKRAMASNSENLSFSDIGIKYSRDGFVTIFLYDYEYDTLHFPGRHYLPLPVAEYQEDYFIPEYDFKLLAYSEVTKPKEKNKKPSYKSQKVRIKRKRSRSATACPVY
jgi:tetratricopeptide (TPR) repeat protein